MVRAFAYNKWSSRHLANYCDSYRKFPRNFRFQEFKTYNSNWKKQLTIFKKFQRHNSNSKNVSQKSEVSRKFPVWIAGFQKTRCTELKKVKVWKCDRLWKLFFEKCQNRTKNATFKELDYSRLLNLSHVFSIWVTSQFYCRSHFVAVDLVNEWVSNFLTFYMKTSHTYDRSKPCFGRSSTTSANLATSRRNWLTSICSATNQTYARRRLNTATTHAATGAPSKSIRARITRRNGRPPNPTSTSPCPAIHR